MKEYYVGQSAEYSKTITESDVLLFAGFSGDFNPVHLNKEIAKNSIFGDRVAHGMLVASFISTVLGMYLPGKGTVYLNQNIVFKNPVYIGDKITVSVKITKILEKRKAELDTKIINQEGKIVIDGKALVLLPDDNAEKQLLCD